MKPKLVTPVLMWAIVVVGIFIAVKFVSKNQIIPDNPILPFLIVPATVYWAYFFIGAIVVHR